MSQKIPKIEQKNKKKFNQSNACYVFDVSKLKPILHLHKKKKFNLKTFFILHLYGGNRRTPYVYHGYDRIKGRKLKNEEFFSFLFYSVPIYVLISNYISHHLVLY